LLPRGSATAVAMATGRERCRDDITGLLLHDEVRQCVASAQNLTGWTKNRTFHPVDAAAQDEMRHILSKCCQSSRETENKA